MHRETQSIDETRNKESEKKRGTTAQKLWCRVYCIVNQIVICSIGPRERA